MALLQFVIVYYLGNNAYNYLTVVSHDKVTEKQLL